MNKLRSLLISLIYGKKHLREMAFLNSQHELLKANREDEAIIIGRDYTEKYGTF